MATSACPFFQSCFDDWIAQQHEDLQELLTELSADPEPDNEKLKLLTEKGIKHFEEYTHRRYQMLELDSTCYMSPTWCSTFENAFLWIGGCRPTLAIRLVYSVCGSELNERGLDVFILNENKDNLAQIDAHQLQMINTLHCNTIIEEDKMASRFATIQENIAEMPLKRGRVVGDTGADVEHAVGTHFAALKDIIRDADMLRLSTLKELLGILTPRQGVEFLVSTKKLHLSMHEWGKKMNQGSAKANGN